METEEWLGRAVEKQDPVLDIGFIVSRTFYIGDENSLSQITDERYRKPLYTPGIELYADYFLSADVAGSIDELVRYYQDIVRLAQEYGKALSTLRHYFWIRPLVFRKGDFAITFPWYDTFEEADHFLAGITSPNDGVIFDDIEQGWELIVVGKSDRLYLRQSDPDDNQEHFVISTERASLQRQVPEVRERARTIISVLEKRVGVDYWWA